MHRNTLALLLIAVLLGCSHERGSPEIMTFESAEAAARYVKETTFSQPTFTLQIADRFTLGGEPDVMGAGMAIVLDAVLDKGFFPDGFEQKNGYRIYRYKKEN